MSESWPEPSRVGLAAWTSDSSTVSDPRGLLQKRVTLFFLLQLVLSSVGLVLRLATGSVAYGGRVDQLVATDPKEYLGHGAATLVFGVIWLLCRRPGRSERALQWLEGAGTAVVCAACGMPFLDPCTGSKMIQGSPIGWQMFLIVLVILVARSALVPSSAARTLALGFVAILPVIVGIHGATSTAAGSSLWSAPAEASWMVLIWGISFVLVTGVTSRTIYGLQARIRAAKRLGQYSLEEKLGEGGMGAVYRAHHLMMRRPTAIKLLPPDKIGEESLARFEREVRLTATLTHPSTITVFDYGRTADGVFYYAMELLEGATLEEIVERCGPMPPGRAVRVLTMVASALSEAHDKGLIHRDIKPSNIILCEQGGEYDVAKVLDFGLVKELHEAEDAGLTQAGGVWGTPHYIAPEALAAPSEVDGRGDLYAVGAVGYYLLTGRPVFDGATAVEVCSHHLHSPVPALEQRGATAVPAALEQVIVACLAKDPAARPQTAGELRRRLQAVDVERWDAENARAWWQEHGQALGDGQDAEAATEFADTIAVDLASSHR
ncbi:MAG: serine/threonine protein kinase [Deltaproteobacteria bacterium]|jgi:serine/threonine-protein kinase|nr:serine/threonine protein kinase [Deltaproteobacteria bacterium]MBW2537708.1 serine/threonine protein kinase [Deltaproteobacteria bacterium]